MADNADLATLSVTELSVALLEKAELVSRALVEECAKRGEAMITRLGNLLETTVPDEDDGAWWLQIHAAMIYGRMPEERAGEALARLMRRIADRGDEDVQDWLAGYWPGLFAAKPEAVLMAVREIASDRKLDWYARLNALYPVIARAQRVGSEALEQELVRVAAIAADETEDRELRLEAGNLLLDFPRLQHRPLLERLAEWQGDFGVHFSAKDVSKAYAQGKDEPPWHTFEDPWGKFYAPGEIARRAMEPGAEEDPFCADDSVHAADGPFVRDGPKVGRNDPCPCGSGRKYKKCCLANAGPS